MSLRPKKNKWRSPPDVVAMKQYQERLLKIEETRAHTSDAELRIEKERAKNLKKKMQVEAELAKKFQKRKVPVADAKSDENQDQLRQLDGKFADAAHAVTDKNIRRDYKMTILRQKRGMGLASDHDLGELAAMESGLDQMPEGDIE